MIVENFGCWGLVDEILMKMDLRHGSEIILIRSLLLLSDQKIFIVVSLHLSRVCISFVVRVVSSD